MRHELTATENGRVEYLMVDLPRLTVLWSFLLFSGLLNILSIRFKLMIVTFTSLHLGLVHVCAWCNVLTRDVRSGALFATPPSCGFAALSHAIFSRGVNVVFHLPPSSGLWCFSLGCLEQHVNLLPCSVCSVRTVFLSPAVLDGTFRGNPTICCGSTRSRSSQTSVAGSARNGSWLTKLAASTESQKGHPFRP